MHENNPRGIAKDLKKILGCLYGLVILNMFLMTDNKILKLW